MLGIEIVYEDTIILKRVSKRNAVLFFALLQHKQGPEWINREEFLGKYMKLCLHVSLKMKWYCIWNSLQRNIEFGLSVIVTTSAIGILANQWAGVSQEMVLT